MRGERLRLGRGLRLEGNPVTLAAEVFLPERLSAGTKLLVCLPGGGVDRHYWDLADGADRAFSFAAALTARGHVVAAIDPPGVGESSKPEDGYELTLARQLPVLTEAVADLRSRRLGGIDLSAFVPIGVGHSAGAMLTLALQDYARPYDAVVALCFGTLGLPRYLRPDYLATIERDGLDPARIPEFARKQFRAGYFPSAEGREGSGAAGRALERVKTHTVAAIAIQAMTPGNIAGEIAAIDVPVFNAQGEHDITGPADRVARDFAGCPDFTQLVVAGAGHHVFVVPAAQDLFDRMATWLDRLP